MRIAFLTPADDYPEDCSWSFKPQAEALRANGAQVDGIRWTEAGNLSGYDLVLPLLTWGYHLRYQHWLEFLDRLEREQLPVVNPPTLLRWNSDKAYLAGLPSHDVSTIPTVAVDSCTDDHLAEARQLFGKQEIVVKPPVSAGAWGTYRLAAGEGLPQDLEGQRVIVQPMIDSVVTTGEYSLLLFDGELSHAVVKRPKSGDFRVQPHLGGSTIRCDPPLGSETLAKVALAAVPAHATYARIDMVEGDDGRLMIMEMELIEPALFLGEAPEGTPAFVKAVMSAAERARE